MTVPIIPGPFSFLGEAGKAAGAIGTALQAEHDQKVREAGQRFATLMDLISSGRLPSTTLNSPEAGQMFRDLGINLPTPSTSPATRQPGDIPLPAAPGAAGLTGPDGAPIPAVRGAPAVSLPLFQLTPQEIASRMRASALTNVPSGSAAERAVTQVPSEPVAAAGEQTAVAGGVRAGNEARASGPAADASIAGDQLHQALYTGAMQSFGNDERLRPLAIESTLGLLPLRIAQMENNRFYFGVGKQEIADRARTAGQLLVQIGDTYRANSKTWADGLQTQLTNAQVNGADVNDPTVRASVTQQYTRDVGPQPTYQGIHDAVLQAAGLTNDQFTSSLSALLGPPGGGRNPAPAPATPAAVSNQKISQAVTHLTQTGDVSSLIQSYRNGSWTRAELQTIRNRATGLTAAQLKQIDDALTPVTTGTPGTTPR